MALTALQVRAAKPKDKPYRLSDGKGFTYGYRIRQKNVAI